MSRRVIATEISRMQERIETLRRYGGDGADVLERIEGLEDEIAYFQQQTPLEELYPIRGRGRSRVLAMKGITK